MEQPGAWGHFPRRVAETAALHNHERRVRNGEISPAYYPFLHVWGFPCFLRGSASLRFRARRACAIAYFAGPKSTLGASFAVAAASKYVASGLKPRIEATKLAGNWRTAVL
jgi:hypothetical protein